MKSSSTLELPASGQRVSRSPSPVAYRQPSRSPQPYRRRQPRTGSKLVPGNEHLQPPTHTSSPARSRTHSPLSRGISESGTEADDELARRLMPPTGQRRTSSEDDHYDGEDDEESFERGRQKRKAEGPALPKRRRMGIRIVRRGVELGLFAILGAIVLCAENGRIWTEVTQRKREIVCWGVPYVAIVIFYPLRILLRSGNLRLPQSTDPAPLIYPTILPILIALALTPKDPTVSNPYLLANLLISLSSLPPALIPSWDCRWILSLVPLLPSTLERQDMQMVNNTLPLIPPINTTLTSALSNLLRPSLTANELRLLSSALINLFLHSISPQATILKALMWGGGLGVLLLCEDFVKWNINLARVPIHRFQRAGNTVMGISRLRRLAALKFKKRDQASDSEGDMAPLIYQNGKSRRGRKSFYTALTPAQAKTRRLAYSSAVYGIIVVIVMVGLRPYIAREALDGLDPFLWASGYLFCGQPWYQKIVDRYDPGTGYCVTEGSTDAANLRLKITGYWIVVLGLGIGLAVRLSTRVQVDTRRKVFHGLAITMFLIPGLLDPPFVHLCLSLALAVFLLLDLIRAGQIPPASGRIARFLQPYVDGRDLKGPVVISHVFLLVGCGIGWWLTFAAYEQNSWEWTEKSVDLGFISGVVCVGLGDTAASLVGRRIGKTKWGWRGGKSVEGSLAFLFAVTTGLAMGRWWVVGTEGNWGWKTWVKICAASAWGSMAEASISGVNDNVVVPVGVWMVVRALGL